MVPCNIIAAILDVVFALCIGRGEGLNLVTGRQIGIMFVESVFILPVSFTLLTIGPSYISAPESALFTLVQTVIGPFIIWLGGFEAPPISAVYGGIIVLIALIVNCYFAIREEKHQERLEEEARSQKEAASSAKAAIANGDEEIPVDITDKVDDDGETRQPSPSESSTGIDEKNVHDDKDAIAIEEGTVATIKQEESI